MTRTFDYSVFGLNVRSAIELPELFPAEEFALPDVEIRTGSLAESESRPGLHLVGDALLLTVPKVARYRIEAGRKIHVEPEPAVPDRNVRLFLLGSAFGALLHQRGLLPLHANAVEIDGKAVAFMGKSGAGKSTLAAWFHDRGFRVIADDVCVIRFGAAGEARACPGLPRLRLWAEALELMGYRTGDYSQSYVGDEELRKFDVPIEAADAATGDVPLAALYLLERGDSFEIAKLRGLEAAEAIFANTYRGSFISATGATESHWRSSINLARNLPVFLASREWNIRSLGDQCTCLLEHARNGIGPNPT